MRYRNPDRRRDATLFDSLTASLREAECACDASKVPTWYILVAGA
jgi:hypothetical protein